MPHTTAASIRRPSWSLSAIPWETHVVHLQCILHCLSVSLHENKKPSCRYMIADRTVSQQTLFRGRIKVILRYIRRWISRKPLEIEAWFQRTIIRKWLAMGDPKGAVKQYGWLS